MIYNRPTLTVAMTFNPDDVITTSLGKMSIRQAFNMLDYTEEDFIGFDKSMILSYIESIIPCKNISYEN